MAEWPANGDTDWNTKMLAYLAVQHNTDGTHNIPRGYILLQDVQAQNTTGQTLTAGAWRTVRLNTEVNDTLGNATLSSNQITLDAGTYECSISCPLTATGPTQSRLYNSTDASVEVWGNTVEAQGGVLATELIWIEGRFTIASQKTFQIEVYPTLTGTGGSEANVASISERYCTAKFIKVS